MYTSIHRRFTRRRTLGFLDEIDSSFEEGTTGYYVPDAKPGDIEDQIRIQVCDLDVIAEMIPFIASSSTGAVLFWGNIHKCLIFPPFPVNVLVQHRCMHTQVLKQQLQKSFIISVVLIRLGEYAVGIYQGENLMDHKHGTGLVHARHKKGGSSQRRFERHREKQIEMFFTRICQNVREKLELHGSNPDYLFYGGERNTIAAFRKQCSYLQRFDTCVVDRMINIRKPNRVALDTAIREVWSSELIEWAEA